jgi:teichuronic acid biosynthesis glycosyltransferase TuaC
MASAKIPFEPAGVSMKRDAPIHVLTLTPFFPSEQDEAAGCFVAEPLRALADRGVISDVFALQPFYRAKQASRADHSPAKWYRYASWPRSAGLPAAGAFAFARIVGRVRELHRDRHIDLIHAHAPLPCGHTAMLLSAELGIPYVVSVHGLDVFSSDHLHGRASQWCERISQRVYRASRRVVCISEHVREKVLEGARGCRTSVVYNGVDANLFSAAAASESASPLVLSVGNLIPIKGHDALIRASASLRSEFPKLKLEIIGEGPERDRLVELTRKLGIEDAVQFRGRQPRAEIAAAMQRCTVFALPSRYEGLGCVYLEAMAVGKPVIGCRDQGIAEIIQQGTNGFLVGPGNEKELTLALAMLLRNETLRRSLGAIARDTVLERFTLAQQAENLARIYRESSA